MHIRRSLLVVVAVAVLASGPIVASAPAQQELVIANQADLTVLDPIKIQEAPTSFVAGFVYEQLVRRTHDGKIAPALAESWKLSPDRRTWTFSLRKGVKFHDGSEFDASIVDWHFKRAWIPRKAASSADSSR